MSEAAQAEDVIFDFETCEEINLFLSNVRFPSLHDVARRVTV